MKIIKLDKILLLTISLFLSACLSTNKLSNPKVDIKQNQEIKSPLLITGNSNGVWFGNEGQLGTVELIDNDGNKLSETYLDIIEEDWMTKVPVNFKAKLKFEVHKKQNAKLVFKNSNQSESEGIDKSFTINVIITP